MTDQTLETQTLESLAAKIAELADEADNRTIEVAKLVCETRRRFEDGKAGDDSWSEWSRANIELGESRIRELLRIGNSDDPMGKLKEIRSATNNRVRRHRENKNSPTLRNVDRRATATAEKEAERGTLIEWVHEAPLDQVADVLSYIDKFTSSVSMPNLDKSAVPADS